MSFFPKDLFLFSQVFGVFPLTCTRQPDHSWRVEFSRCLHLKCLLVLTFLTVSSYFALYVDYTGYHEGHPIRMSKSTATLAVMVDVALLNLMALLIFYGVVSNYPAFIQLSNALQNIDRTLELNIHHPRSSLKVMVVYVHVTCLITITTVLRSRESLQIVLYVPFWTTYYIVGSLLLQFDFVLQTLTARFEAINQRIEEAVMKQSFEHLLMVDLGLSKSNLKSPGVTSPVYQLQVLTDSYCLLCSAVQQANSFYRSQVLATVSSSLIHNIITLYFLIVDLQQASLSLTVLVQFSWALSRVLHIVLLLWPCASLTRALQLFLLKLRHFSAEFSALGFFPIHRSILTSIASSVATYLVVMLQLEGFGSTAVLNTTASTHRPSYTN